jgi:hypothetical protein
MVPGLPHLPCRNRVARSLIRLNLDRLLLYCLANGTRMRPRPQVGLPPAEMIRRAVIEARQGERG